MAEHRNLTGASLHETKGADAAAADTVLIADGAGATSWGLVSTDNLNTSSFFNINKYWVTIHLPDISTASAAYFPVTHACTLTKVTTIIDGAISGSDSVLTVTNSNGPTTIGTITVAQSGSAAGDIDSLAPSANNTFTAGTYVKVATDGGSSNTVAVTIYLEFTQTS